MKIPITDLISNPLNANVMPVEIFEKLKVNIKKQEGKYPALIVRKVGEKYRLVDGHNRKRALEELEYKEAECEVWDIDDETELLLLSTLNELKGTQDLTRRAVLLQAIIGLGIEKDNLLGLIPEDSQRLDFVLSIVKDVSGATDDIRRETEREAVKERFIKQGIEPRRAEAMADIYVFEQHVPKLEQKEGGEKVGQQEYLIFAFENEERYKKACDYFETDEKGNDPKAEKLMELI